MKDATAKTLTLSGIPTDDGSFLVSTVGGMEGSTVSFNCNITRVLPTKTLTGDWYHIQDAWEVVPAEIKNVITLTNGSDPAFPVVWNPTYVESTGSAPAGCTVGAVNIERGGSVTWTLPSLVELKSNIHFTGTRTLKIEWTIGGVTKSWTSASLAKQTMLNWDMMLAIGLEPTKKPVTVKFTNTATSGGVRMYDFYVKTYDVESAIKTITAPKAAFQMYQTETALIVYGDIATLNIYNLSGSVVAHSTLSQLVETNKLTKGIYLVQITDKVGRTATQKFIKQ
jgi:hypothetical protein